LRILVAVSAAVILGFTCSGAHLEAQGRPSAELDIPYRVDAGAKERLDLYVPPADSFPAILFVHGGSLVSGDRKDEPLAAIAQSFADQDIACALMSYRLAPEHAWPDQPDDVAAAFFWLKQHIADRGGDPNRIFLFGHSSGCLLVSIVAADSTYLGRYGLHPGDVAGVIPMGCRLDDNLEVTVSPPEPYESSWVPPDGVGKLLEEDPVWKSLDERNRAVPSKFVGKALPPTLILIAEEERFFPPILRDASEFVGRALAAGAEADLVILPDRRHATALEYMANPGDPTMELVVRFIHER